MGSLNPTDRRSVRCPRNTPERKHGNRFWHAVGMAGSDTALLSSIVSQIEDLTHRVTELAETYGSTPDSAIASEMFAAERSLVSARRALERAGRFMGL
jgi:hypothetical protein